VYKKKSWREKATKIYLQKTIRLRVLYLSEGGGGRRGEKRVARDLATRARTVEWRKTGARERNGITGKTENGRGKIRKDMNKRSWGGRGGGGGEERETTKTYGFVETIKKKTLTVELHGGNEVSRGV